MLLHAGSLSRSSTRKFKNGLLAIVRPAMWIRIPVKGPPLSASSINAPLTGTVTSNSLRVKYTACNDLSGSFTADSKTTDSEKSKTSRRHVASWRRICWSQKNVSFLVRSYTTLGIEISVNVPFEMCLLKQREHGFLAGREYISTYL